MAWGVKNIMAQRILFCEAVLIKEISIAEACRRFEISRPTGYEWLRRYEKEGEIGLVNRSSKRYTQEHKTSQHIEDMIILTKAEFPRFGPKKILPKLLERYPEQHWPCVTTIHNILLSNGLVINKKIRQRFAAKNSSLYEAIYPNDVWCMDFKGWFITKDGQKYDPFTLTDNDSRYLLRCNKLNRNTTEHVWALLEMAFKEYGLPLYLRSDNGPPFATTCPGRLSKLSINLIKVGVTPEWIEPGKPQQNGRHERMHLTMKNEGFRLGSSLSEQIKNTEDFINYYNYERPHEALKQTFPGNVYVSSPRKWNGQLNEIEYSDDYGIGRVKSCGKVSWKGKEIYVGRVLEGENVGIKEGEKGLEMYFGDMYLGLIDGNRLVFERREGRKR